MSNPTTPQPERPDRASSLPTLGRRRRARGGPPPGVWIGIVLFIAATIAAWFLFQSGDDSDPTMASAPELSRSDTLESGSGAPAVPPLELPELSASDAFVRRVVSALSSHPQLAAWLTTDDLVDRFVSVIIDLAGNSTPASHIRFMAPSEPFQVREAGGRLLIDEASYERFNLLAATFASLDTPGTVQLYRQLLPLIEESYEELGIADYTFDETLRLAIQNVVAVQLPDGPLEVEPDEAVFAFRDPDLEARRGAAKQLIRMGPENARLIQAKMRELAQGLGIPTTP